MQTTNWKRPFFLIWTGQAISLLGSSLVQFALIWWLTKQTGSAAVLATATLVAILPTVFLGPFAGALVDRWSRRVVMIVSDACVALATLILVVLFWLGITQPWHIYVILFFRSLTGVFQGPAMLASTSLMVPQEHLSRITGLNQALRGLMGIAAPPLGALLLELLPMFGVLSVDVVTALIAIIPLFFVFIPQPARQSSAEVTPRAVLRDVRDGLKYVFSWPGLLGIILLAMVLNFLFAPIGSFMPLLITEHFHGNAWHLGGLESVEGVGIIIGGLGLGLWGGFKKQIHTSLVGIIGMSLGIVLTSAAPADKFWIALVGIGWVGLMSPIANGPLMAILQARVDPEMQGRVITVLDSGATAMMPISLALAAPIAEFFGVRMWFFIAGGLCALIALAAFFIKPIVTVEDNGQHSIQAVPEPTMLAE